MPKTDTSLQNEAAWPDVRRMRVGDVGLDLAPEGLRNVTFRGQRLVAEIYPALRRPDWSTQRPAVVSEHVELGETSAELVRVVEDVDVRSVLRVSISDGVLHLDSTVQALRRVALNRWGLNVCLDASDWAESVVDVDGVPSRLPKDVAPQQEIGGVLQGLFPPGERLSFTRDDGAAVVLRSTGLRLEAEDQRNWTDPTFKIYSGSLADPRPVTIAAGARRTQSLSVQLEAGTPARARMSAPAWQRVALPELGVQANDVELQEGDSRLLDILGVDRVRLDVESHVRVAPPLGQAEVPELEVAVLLGELDEEGGAAVDCSGRRLPGPLPVGSRVLVHGEGRRSTGAAEADACAAALAPGSVGLEVVPGTDAYFTDVNRDRPLIGGRVSFSIVPTVHTADSETLFRSLREQARVVRQARSTLAARVHVSPITLRLRGDPEGQHTASHRRRVDQVHLDRRIHELEGAAWTVGSIHAVADGGAESGTWHELLGERGLVRRDGDGSLRFSPAFHAIGAVAKLVGRASPARRAGVRDVWLLGVPGSPWIGLASADRGRAVVASLRPWAQVVNLPEFAGGSVARLGEADVETARATAEWWEVVEREPLGPSVAVSVGAFEVAVLHRRTTREVL
jgi:hypothetical protein